MTITMVAVLVIGECFAELVNTALLSSPSTCWRD
jgi:hypothetical protein